MQAEEGEHGVPRSTERYFAGTRAQPDDGTHAFGAGAPPISALYP
jgi:hypothetical protein